MTAKTFENDGQNIPSWPKHVQNQPQSSDTWQVKQRLEEDRMISTHQTVVHFIMKMIVTKTHETIE